MKKESATENMPFGENANRALEHILKLGERLGFRTKNLDGYCGYIEFGEGEELLRNSRAFRCSTSRRWLDIFSF